MPACHELAEAVTAEREPFRVPRSQLGVLCHAAKSKAVLDPCFSSCANTQRSQGLIALPDTFFHAVEAEGTSSGTVR